MCLVDAMRCSLSLCSCLLPPLLVQAQRFSGLCDVCTSVILFFYAGDAESAATDYMLALELEQAGVSQGKQDRKQHE
jgi:hypothetical protein